MTTYQYGATLTWPGQIFEFFLGDATMNFGELSVRGAAGAPGHQGTRINSRNGSDSTSVGLQNAYGVGGVFMGGALVDLPQNFRLTTQRVDAYFTFSTGVDDNMSGGEELARIGTEGLRLPQRASAPTVASGYTVIWAKTDGTVQKTSNVGGTTTTAQL